MQIYEIILAAATVAALAAMLFGRRSNIPFFGCTLIQWSALVVHVVQSGLRWQMAAFYLTSVIFLAVAILKCLHLRLPRLKRFVSVLLVIVLICLLAASSLLACAFPAISLPEPTGVYRVGTQSFHLVDSSRAETYTADPDDVRELMVSLWYPAEASSASEEEAYIPEMDQVENVLSVQVGIPAFLFQTVRQLKTRSVAFAAIAEGEKAFPVLVFSHGMGMSRHLYSSFLEELASHGYVVAAIDHTYSTMATVFPDGKITTFLTSVDSLSMSQTNALLDVWARDIDFVLTQLVKWNTGIDNTVLKGRLDLGNIGIFGHSFGGAAAYKVCCSNDKVKAGVNLDGSVYVTAEQLGGTEKAFMVMANEEYAKAILESNSAKPYEQLTLKQQEEMNRLGVTREQYESTLEMTRNAYRALKNGMDNGGLLISIAGSKHYNFSDIPLLSPATSFIGMSGEINGKRGIEIVNAYLLAFFDQHLKGDENISCTLLAGKYPESKIETVTD